jgi:CHASE3 domain sensor protein
MGNLSLGKKILIGFIIWVAVMAVLLIIYLIRLNHLTRQERLVAEFIAHDVAYEQQSAVLLRRAEDLDHFGRTLVLPQVGTTLRLD